MEDLTGKKFWKVAYNNGAIEQFEVLGMEGNNVKVSRGNITDFRDNKYNLIKFKHFGTSAFPYDIVLINKDGNYFTNLSEAKKESLKRFRHYHGGEWRVGRYFDDIFEAYETDPLNKVDAQAECNKLNKRDRHHVQYRISRAK